MTKVKDDYLVGLDIGTNSCGWVATDKQNNILKLQGKTAIGARLFEEGKTAADRRGFRTTRRRLKRRKWRLRLLQEIFDPFNNVLQDTLLLEELPLEISFNDDIKNTCVLKTFILISN